MTLRNLSLHPGTDLTIVTEGGLEPLVSMLYSSDDALQEAALLALRNLSVSDDNKPKVVRQGGLPALVALLASGNVSIQEQAIVVLRNLSLDPENEVHPSTFLALLVQSFTGKKVALLYKKYKYWR